MRNRIAYYRKLKNVTQDELAKVVGISRPYLSDIENGKYVPGGSLTLKIAKALGEPVEKIFFTDDVQYKEHGKSKPRAG